MNEVSARGYMVVTETADGKKMGALWLMWALLMIWLLFSQVVAIRAVWSAVKGARGAMLLGTSVMQKTRKAKGHAQRDPFQKGVQAEIYDLDGVTLEGLKMLCACFGLNRIGLRDELMQRIKAELHEREESYSKGAQQ